MIIKEAIKDVPKDMPIRILFQDEIRCGRINNSRRCWVPMKERPIVSQQIVREFVYAIGAVSPMDGKFTSLIMPWIDTEIMSIFLTHTSLEFKNDFCLMFLDKAGWHTTNELYVPENMKLLFLPPYSPELNPVEPIWRYLRENYFRNYCFSSLDEVENILCSGLCYLGENPSLVFSLTCFDWIKTLSLTSK